MTASSSNLGRDTAAAGVERAQLEENPVSREDFDRHALGGGAERGADLPSVIQSHRVQAAREGLIDDPLERMVRHRFVCRLLL